MNSMEKNRKDVRQVGFVARLEDVGHFRVFEEAYEEWFGRKAPGKVIEHEFQPYLRTGVAPFWVRNYTRHVIHDNRVWLRRKVERVAAIAGVAVTLTLLLSCSVLLHFRISG